MIKYEWVSYEVIKNFKIENNLGDNIVDVISFLKILEIKNKTIHNWEITMKGPKNSLYEKGIFTITIDFPYNFSDGRPEIRLKTKIYHLNVNPSNGHISEPFIHNWKPTTPIVDILIGIFLTFFAQDPGSPYSGKQAKEYETNFKDFKRKAEEWTIKYATSFKAEELNKMEKIRNEKIDELEVKNKLLIEKVKELESHKNDLYKDKYIKSLEEIQELKSKRPIEILPGEKLISVIFQCAEFHYSIICKDTDIFAKVESLLYEQFPQYKESEQYFISSGQKVNRFQTLKENGIKNSGIIIMQKCGFE